MRKWFAARPPRISLRPTRATSRNIGETMQLAHVARAMRAVTAREIVKFVQQRGRLLSALVRPLMWLAAFAAGVCKLFGAPINPPYQTYITYPVYNLSGLS